MKARITRELKALEKKIVQNFGIIEIFIRKVCRRVRVHMVRFAASLHKKYTRCTYILAALVCGCMGYFVFPRDYSSCTTLFGVIVTVYVAFYAIAWAKYEFHITRQSQQVSILSALCATDKRKQFAPALAEMTHKKLPLHPTLLTPRIIFASLCAAPDARNYLTEDNLDTINVVSKILLGFDNWKKAELPAINLNYTNLNGANLREICLCGACLCGANLQSANLFRANLCAANLHRASLYEANLSQTYMYGVNLREADLGTANLRGADLNRADLSGANLYEANLYEANLNGVSLNGANLNGADLREITPKEESMFIHLAEILNKAKTLYNAKLPAAIEIILRSNHPHLFEDPNLFPPSTHFVLLR